MENKVAIITGASSGIGLACVKEFARQKYNVVLAARSTEQLKQIEKDINNAEIESLVVTTDVSKQNDCENLIDKTMKRFGRIDVLVNNAGLSMRAIVEDVEIDVLKRLMDVNFWGTVYCTKYALPSILKSKGSVIGVSSIAGFIGLPARSGYSASKFAMHGFLETLRNENLKTGLNVLIVAPGFTASNVRNAALVADGSNQGETPREESKMMTAEEVAKRLFEAYKKKKNKLVLTFKEGKLTVFLNKFVPSLVGKLAFKHMAKEPDTPLRK